MMMGRASLIKIVDCTNINKVEHLVKFSVKVTLRFLAAPFLAFFGELAFFGFGFAAFVFGDLAGFFGFAFAGDFFAFGFFALGFFSL